MNAANLLRVTRPATVSCRFLNCWTAGIAKKNRKNYLLTYPTTLVFPNGSSIQFDYVEPKQIVILPANLNEMSEEERLQRLELRNPKMKVKIEEEVEIDFDASKYIKFLKK